MKPAPPQTAESIRLAREQNAAERQAIEAQTGLTYDEHGCWVPPPFVERCPRCGFVVNATEYGKAIRGMSAHLVYHVTQEQAC